MYCREYFQEYNHVPLKLQTAPPPRLFLLCLFRSSAFAAASWYAHVDLLAIDILVHEQLQEQHEVAQVHDHTRPSILNRHSCNPKNRIIIVIIIVVVVALSLAWQIFCKFNLQNETVEAADCGCAPQWTPLCTFPSA